MQITWKGIIKLMTGNKAKTTDDIQREIAHIRSRIISTRMQRQAAIDAIADDLASDESAELNTEYSETYVSLDAELAALERVLERKYDDLAAAYTREKLIDFDQLVSQRRAQYDKCAGMRQAIKDHKQAAKDLEKQLRREVATLQQIPDLASWIIGTNNAGQRLHQSHGHLNLDAFIAVLKSHGAWEHKIADGIRHWQRNSSHQNTPQWIQAQVAGVKVEADTPADDMMEDTAPDMSWFEKVRFDDDISTDN